MDMLIPFFLAMLGGEALYAWWRGYRWYRLHDTIANLSTAVVMVLTIGYFEPSRAIYDWIERHCSTGWLSQSAWWQLLIAFVVLDFILYWIHRIAHKNGLLWAAHEVHHQSEEMNYSVALRQSSFLYLNSWLFLLPFAVAGFSVDVLRSVHLVSLLYEFVVHTKAFSSIPWLERVFVMPVHHRVHHARNEAYLDRNFGSVLIIWDRLFGTFASESRDDPVEYGIHRKLPSHSPLVANLIGFRDVLSKAARSVLGRASGQPGAQAHQAKQAGRPPVMPALPQALSLYGLVQFLLCLALLGDYLFGLSGTYIVNREVELAVLVVGFLMVPAIYDGDARLALREYLRCGAWLTLGAVNLFWRPEYAALSLALMLWGGLSMAALWRMQSPSLQTA